jgi:hypothetical protein
MRQACNLREITVGMMPYTGIRLQDGTAFPAGNNAVAWPGQLTAGVGGITAPLATGGVGNVNMYLDSGIQTMTKYLPLAGGTIDVTDWHQSAFNTILHELSHHILNTDDIALANPPADGQANNVANGTRRALACVAQAPADAYRNAENWGIFLEAVHRGIT